MRIVNFFSCVLICWLDGLLFYDDVSFNLFGVMVCDGAIFNLFERWCLVVSNGVLYNCI